MKKFATMYRGMFYLPQNLMRPEGYIVEKISTKAIMPIVDVAVVDEVVVAAKNSAKESRKKTPEKKEA